MLLLYSNVSNFAQRRYQSFLVGPHLMKAVGITT